MIPWVFGSCRDESSLALNRHGHFADGGFVHVVACTGTSRASRNKSDLGHDTGLGKQEQVLDTKRFKGDVNE